MKGLALLVASLMAAGAVLVGGLQESAGLTADVDALKLQVLSSPAIGLRPGARQDVENGRVDTRVLQILILLSEHHRLDYVGPFVTGHSYYVAGTNRPSNHAFGRAVDIPIVDGVSVSPSNLGALRAATYLGNLSSELKPDEIGAPWSLHFGGVNTFTKGHSDHIHAGFRERTVG